MTKTIIVIANKGGVGKSTVAFGLAKSLAKMGHIVGLIDADISNPTQAKLSGTTGQKLQASDKVKPVEIGNLKIVSTRHILPDEDTPVTWIGDRRLYMLKQYVKGIDWGNLDFLVVDMPAGINEESFELTEYLNPVDGAVIVTTPQEVSLINVRKIISLCKRLNIPIIGLIENMSGFECPECHAKIEIFKSGKSEKMCEELKINFLGKIPLHPNISSEADEGKTETLINLKEFKDIVSKVASSVAGPKPVVDTSLLSKLEG